MSTPKRLLATLSAATLALAACGARGDGPSNEVVIDLVAFMPQTLSVKVGSTVTWTQDDAGAHTVTSGTVERGNASVAKEPDGLFDSGSVEPGSEFEFAFNKAGTYPYFCELHPATMRGEIRVT